MNAVAKECECLRTVARCACLSEPRAHSAASSSSHASTLSCLLSCARRTFCAAGARNRRRRASTHTTLRLRRMPVQRRRVSLFNKMPSRSLALSFSLCLHTPPVCLSVSVSLSLSPCLPACLPACLPHVRLIRLPPASSAPSPGEAESAIVPENDEPSMSMPSGPSVAAVASSGSSAAAGTREARLHACKQAATALSCVKSSKLACVCVCV